jgi:hypothetical protein
MRIAPVERDACLEVVRSPFWKAYTPTVRSRAVLAAGTVVLRSVEEPERQVCDRLLAWPSPESIPNGTYAIPLAQY